MAAKPSKKPAPKPPAKRPPEPARTPPPPPPATHAEARHSDTQPARKPSAPVKAPPAKRVNKPAPRPVVNKPAPRPRPGGKLSPSPTTVPLDSFPALSAEEVQILDGLGVMQPGSTDGLPSNEVAAYAAGDLFAAQVQVDLSANTYLRALSVKGAIFRGINAIYNRGGATIHSGRARQHVMDHIHGYRI